MKPEKLIELLKECDPDGEVCVNNVSVTGLQEEPAYWDGKLQLIEADDEGSCLSAKVTGAGRKISLDCPSIHSIIEYKPDLKIDLSGVSGEQRAWWEKSIEESKQSSKDVERDCELKHFIEHMLDRVTALGWDGCQRLAKRRITAVFNKDVDARKLPEDLKWLGDGGWNWYDRREVQWLREFSISLEEELFYIQKQQSESSLGWKKSIRAARTSTHKIKLLKGMILHVLLDEDEESNTWSDTPYQGYPSGMLHQVSSVYLPPSDSRGAMRRYRVMPKEGGEVQLVFTRTNGDVVTVDLEVRA